MVKTPDPAADAPRDMAGSTVAPEERIAETFSGYFAKFDIRIEARDVAVGSRREIHKEGWRITFSVLADDGGFPSLEFYATHRMTDDRHVRIWADGHAEGLDAIWSFYGHDPSVPGSQEAAEEEYLRHNREVARELREAGLYPHGDINAFLRTGGDRNDDEADGTMSGPDGGDPAG